MKCRIINDDGGTVSSVTLSDLESFSSLSDFLDGLGYSLEEDED